MSYQHTRLPTSESTDSLAAMPPSHGHGHAAQPSSASMESLVSSGSSASAHRGHRIRVPRLSKDEETQGASPLVKAGVVKGDGLMLFITCFASLGVFLFGYDQGVMSGIITTPHFRSYFDNPPPSEIGTMVAVLEIGAFFTSLASGTLADVFGRKAILFWGALIFSVGGAIQTLTNGFTTMVIGRIVAGAGVGFMSMIVPAYQSEISPAENRGKLACIEFTGNIIGYASSVWVDYFFSYIPSDLSWRMPLSLQVIIGITLCLGSLLLPESPRWLIDNDRDTEAMRVLADLHGHGDPRSRKARREYREIKENVLDVREEEKDKGRGYREMWRRYKKRTLIACSSQMGAQLNGINVISYYAPNVFLAAGWIGRDAILMAGINAIFYVLSTVPTWFLVDAWGRRPILLSGAVLCSLALFATGGFMYLNKDYTANAVVVCVILFNAAFGYSWGPIPWLYPPEIMPLSYRAKGASLSTATNWFFNYVVGEVTPILQDAIGWRLYIMHAVFCLGSFALVYFTYPETAGKSLEEMGHVFGDALPLTDDEDDDDSSDDDGGDDDHRNGPQSRPINIDGSGDSPSKPSSARMSNDVIARDHQTQAAAARNLPPAVMTADAEVPAMPAMPAQPLSLPSDTTNPPWKRVLYEAQPYPDWYMPEQATTKMNAAPAEVPTRLSIAVALLPLSQNVNVIFLFLHVFQNLESGALHPTQLILACFAALIVTAAAWKVFSSSSENAKRRRGQGQGQEQGRGKKRAQLRSSSASQVISFAILLLLLYALSPVLKTLTEATSSDTIFPLSFLLFALHLCLADNTLRAPHVEAPDESSTVDDARPQAPQRPQRHPHPQPQLFSALSLNAATSASLVLASRLPSNAHVFALLFAAILAFALLPMSLRRLRPSSAGSAPLARILASTALVPTAMYFAWRGAATGSGTLTMLVLVAAANAFILVAVPAWMRAASASKTRYDGPWRVAKPRLRTRRERPLA